jgi:hypothetical protein
MDLLVSHRRRYHDDQFTQISNSRPLAPQTNHGQIGTPAEPEFLAAFVRCAAL